MDDKPAPDQQTQPTAAQPAIAAQPLTAVQPLTQEHPTAAAQLATEVSSPAEALEQKVESTPKMLTAGPNIEDVYELIKKIRFKKDDEKKKSEFRYGLYFIDNQIYQHIALKRKRENDVNLFNIILLGNGKLVSAERLVVKAHHEGYIKFENGLNIVTEHSYSETLFRMEEEYEQPKSAAQKTQTGAQMKIQTGTQTNNPQETYEKEKKYVIYEPNGNNANVAVQKITDPDFISITLDGLMKTASHVFEITDAKKTAKKARIKDRFVKDMESFFE